MMIETKIQIIPIAYQDDAISVILNHQKKPISLITIEPVNEFIADIQTAMQQQFKLKINSQNIHLLTNHQIQTTIYLTYYVEITIEQLAHLKVEFPYQFDDIEHLIQIDKSDRQLIGAIRERIARQYQLDKLQAIQAFLPKTFTTYYLSSLIPKITHQGLKPNNLRKYFASQLKYMGKDRSHRGYPKTLFQYQKKAE